MSLLAFYGSDPELEIEFWPMLDPAYVPKAEDAEIAEQEQAQMAGEYRIAQDEFDEANDYPRAPGLDTWETLTPDQQEAVRRFISDLLDLGNAPDR